MNTETAVNNIARAVDYLSDIPGVPFVLKFPARNGVPMCCHRLEDQEVVTLHADTPEGREAGQDKTLFGLDKILADIFGEPAEATEPCSTCKHFMGELGICFLASEQRPCTRWEAADAS